MSTMVAVPIAETVKIKRMTEFAADVLELADQRPDLDLRVLVDGAARRPDSPDLRGGLEDD